MKRIESRISKIEKVIKEESDSDDIRKFLAQFDLPEDDDLLVLSVEGLIIQGLAKSGEIPMKRWSQFWDKLKAYCEQMEVEVWDYESVDAFVEGKIGLDAVKCRKSKPSKLLNFPVVVKGLGLEMEED